jgi:hypothetical protein
LSNLSATSNSRGTDVCLLTAGQPSNNPRLVKEADALVEAGYTVQVLCVDCGLWPSQTDPGVLARCSWSCRYIGGTAQEHPLVHRFGRLRQSICRRILPLTPQSSALQRAALLRVGPEMYAAALRHPARLYIAHHVSVLPAAVEAGRRFRARVGYDAEDFYTGMHAASELPCALDRIVDEIERQYLPSCDYITAASWGIAAAYSDKYGISEPVTILNTFPLADRPAMFRPSDRGEPLRLYWFSQCIGGTRGLEDAVRAMGLLRDCEIELHLRGNWQAGYREQLLAVARSAGADIDRIISHAPSPPDDMVRLAAAYDVGLALEAPVSRNREICLSNKLFVYLLAGNALMATNVRGQQSLTAQLGSAASSYAPGDIHSLAAILHDWFSDRDSLDRARRAAWEWGARRYNWGVDKGTFLGAIEVMLTSSSVEQAESIAAV